MVMGPYFANMLNGIVNACEDKLQDVLILTQIHSTASMQALYPLLDGRCDGAIFLAPSEDSPGISYLQEIGFPHIVVSGRNPGSVCFELDNDSGIALAIEHLFELGHRKIGMLQGPEDLSDGYERNISFLKQMRKRGLAINPDWLIPAGFHPIFGLEAGRKLLSLKDRPTAVYCANDEVAIGFYRACKEFNVSIPGDISVIGFDDSPMTTLVEPNLTTIKQPIDLLSRQAAESLIDQIEGLDGSVSSRFTTSLIIRNSTTRPMEDI
jgi:DNA-binding LacI/PurR family transcriptional regulator